MHSRCPQGMFGVKTDYLHNSASLPLPVEDRSGQGRHRRAPRESRRKRDEGRARSDVLFGLVLHSEQRSHAGHRALVLLGSLELVSRGIARGFRGGRRDYGGDVFESGNLDDYGGKRSFKISWHLHKYELQMWRYLIAQIFIITASHYEE